MVWVLVIVDFIVIIINTTIISYKGNQRHFRGWEILRIPTIESRVFTCWGNPSQIRGLLCPPVPTIGYLGLEVHLRHPSRLLG